MPTGTVTFLFTDLEGSTRLWEEYPEAMKEALARHDEILRDAIAVHNGHVVKMRGDGIHAAFATAESAVRAALAAQRALSGEPWESTPPLKVRMGVHTGPAEQRDGDYYGTAVNRAARLMGVAHGGQVVVSLTSEELLHDGMPDTCSLIDLGAHRLQDLSRAEHVFQLDAPGLETQFPPLRSLDSFPSNLPVQVSSFVGRDDELAAVASALTESRIVTITGVGGVGKSRLATQVAAEALPEYDDGAWLCELAAATDEDTLQQIAAASVGAAPRPGVSMLESLVEFLRPRSLLLVLDNCEHLLVAAGRLAERVLHECSDVRVLATSREGLAVEGERVLPLRSLAVPEADAAPPAVVTNASARLFAERGEAARPGFVVDASNAKSIGEICRRLDGIPLALELAAARVAAMSPAEIAGHLDQRFRLLTGGRRTAVERQQTLRATVDWSYSLLEARERVVFDRLGVFAGSFDTAASTAVVTDDEIESWDVIDALGSLVSKSLVLAEEVDDGTTRYQLLETLRQYTRERLEERGEADAFRRRHATYFADFAEVVAPALQGRDERLWRARLRRDLDNLRAALTWSLDSADDEDGELAMRTVAALASQATLDRTAGISAWAQRCLERATRSTPERRARVVSAAAWEATSGGSYERARELTEAAIGDGVLALEREEGFSARGALVVAAMYSGEFDEARRLVADLRAELERPGRTSEPFQWIVNETTAAMVEALEGDVELGRVIAERALLRARETENPTMLGLALYVLGWTTMYADPDRGLEFFDAVIAIGRSGAAEMTYPHALARAAEVRAGREPARALRDLAEAMTFAHDSGSRIAMMAVLDYGISVLVTQGAAEHAAIVTGFLATGRFMPLNPVRGPELDRREHANVRARELLGDAAYSAAVARGAALSYDDLLVYLRRELDGLLVDADD
jgi:predicted ATPase/class 3 adenylate cyclase